MRLPFVSRHRFNAVWRERDEAVAAEVRALKRAKRAELALEMAFGVSVQDVLNRDVKEYKVHVANAVLNRFLGNPRDLMRRELHRMLDAIINDKPGVIG